VSSRAGGIILTLASLIAFGCEAPADEACPAWTRIDGGRCVLRTWVVDASPLGEPGATDVQVALGPEGEALVAWTHATSIERFVVLAEGTEASSFTTQEVTIGEGIALEPAIALGPEGRALLAWKQQADEGRVYLATRDSQGAWRWPDLPTSWSGNAYEPRVEIGSDGEALMVWNQWTGTNFGVALARRDPEDPESPLLGPTDSEQLLSPPVNFSNAPRLVSSETGEVLVTWYQAPIDDLMVYVSERRQPGGSFARPAAQGFVSPMGGPVNSHSEANPQPALHPSGMAAVVWTQQVIEDGIDQAIPVFLATRDPEGTWHRPASLTDSLSSPEAFAQCPLVAFAPEGSMMVTWFQTERDRSEVFAWRRDAEDGEASAALRLSSPDAEAVHPALAIGPDGGAVVVWAERETDTWQVLARRHLPEDNRWLSAEPLSTPQTGNAPTPRIAIADDGRVLVAWAQGSIIEGQVHTASLP